MFLVKKSLLQSKSLMNNNNSDLTLTGKLVPFQPLTFTCVLSTFMLLRLTLMNLVTLTCSPKIFLRNSFLLLIYKLKLVVSCLVFPHLKIHKLKKFVALLWCLKLVIKTVLPSAHQCPKVDILKILNPLVGSTLNLKKKCNYPLMIQTCTVNSLMKMLLGTQKSLSHLQFPLLLVLAL